MTADETIRSIGINIERANYLDYVSALKNEYVIRIVVRNFKRTSKEDHDSDMESILSYLSALPKNTWKMQKPNGIIGGQHMVWFMHKSDALAFKLKWDGVVE